MRVISIFPTNSQEEIRWAYFTKCWSILLKCYTKHVFLFWKRNLCTKSFCKPSHHCLHRMTITVLHPAGNLLNSLMGSGEEDDAAEEAQEDSSPIELDWACPRTKRTNEHTQKKEDDHAASLLHLHNEGGTRLRSVFSEACCSQKPLPTHPV